MAYHVAVPSHFKLQDHKHVFMARTRHLPPTRNYHGNYEMNHQFSSPNAPKLITSNFRMPHRDVTSKTCVGCCCLTIMSTASGAITAEWLPFVDQALLLASITLAYMAGAITLVKFPYNTQKSMSVIDEIPENPPPGSALTSGNEVPLQFAWDVVRSKLMETLSAINKGKNLSDRVGELKQSLTKQVPSLSAIVEGPRIRLLWASLKWLKKEVANISTSTATNSTNDFLGVFAKIIENCCQPLCMAWLEEELCIVSRKHDKEFFSLAEKKFIGYDSIIQNIRKSGKENLYVELVYALRFGSSRKGGFYNGSFFIENAVAILEDFLITLADGIASMYLELISIDSSLCNEMNNLGLSLCILSTRALQRLRNEAALQQWLHQNMAAVVSMYEDQFDLCTLERRLFEESNVSEADNIAWWKRLFVRRPRHVSSSLSFVVIGHVSVPIKRTKELRALTGWRYYFSLFLELADITTPVVKAVVAKASEAVSFFLVCLIGRSLGLIYSGIRNSLFRK